MSFKTTNFFELKLYKYLPPERIDVLSNGLIRFTQPVLFNDPFEMSPFIAAIATQEEITQMFHSQHEGHVRDEFMKLNRRARRKKKFENFQKLYPKAELLPEVIETASGKGLEKAKEQLSEAMTKDLGILCLTTKFDNLLMWAHYAQSHEGMVIEFDGDSNFFRQVFTKSQNSDVIDEELSKDYGYLKEVQYNKSRPAIIISHVNSFDPFLIKGEEWSYEEEWRMLMPTATAQKITTDKKGEDVYLYEIPRAAITKVILGCRAGDELLNSVRQIKEANEELTHLQIERMALDEKDFRLISNIV